MADHNETENHDKPHRGRVQAQGGGTQESEPWAEQTPPTVTETLRKVDLLEAKLTPKERKERQAPFAALRHYIGRAGQSGGIWANPKPHKKSFYKRGSVD